MAPPLSQAPHLAPPSSCSPSFGAWAPTWLLGLEPKQVQWLELGGKFLGSNDPEGQLRAGLGRACGPRGWEGGGSGDEGGPPASPGYPPRLQVARRVSPALPHGRVGPASPARSLALPLLRVLLTEFGVSLPEEVR